MKHRSRRLASALIATMILLSVVPVGALAQGAPGSLLLNQSGTQVGSITVDDHRYQVYRYDNTLPYASGISVYLDGEQVTSEAEVREVLTALAQRRAAGRLGTEEIETLRTVRRQARILANVSGSTAASLNRTTSYLADLANVTVNGSTALNASRRAAPRFAEFNESARDLVPALRTTERRATAVASNATALIDVLQARRNGTETDPQRIYEQYVTTLETIDRLAEQESVSEDLSTVATLAERVASNVSAVPEVGNETAARISTASNSTARAANRSSAAFETLDSLTGFGGSLDDSRDAAESQVEQWMANWQDRRYAPRDIYGTIAAVPVVLVGAVAYTRWWR